MAELNLKKKQTIENKMISPLCSEASKNMKWMLLYREYMKQGPTLTKHKKGIN